MPQSFEPGDYLVFQLESGYALLRVLGLDGSADDPIWHLAAYNELFLDVDMAENAIQTAGALSVDKPHLALTNRAFESTQVAKISTRPLEPNELAGLTEWQNNPTQEVHDRSVRLLLGLR